MAKEDKVQKKKISDVNSICIMMCGKGETNLNLGEPENHWSCFVFTKRLVQELCLVAQSISEKGYSGMDF